MSNRSISHWLWTMMKQSNVLGLCIQPSLRGTSQNLTLNAGIGMALPQDCDASTHNCSANVSLRCRDRAKLSFRLIAPGKFLPLLSLPLVSGRRA